MSSQSTELPPMGWYPDPTDASQERYWDGTRWTKNVREPIEQPAWVAGLGARTAHAPSRSSTGPGEPAGDVAPPAPSTASGAPSAAPQVGQAPVQFVRQWDHTTASWRDLPVVDPVRRTADGVVLAGWWRRAVGRTIDDLLVTALTLLAAWRQVGSVVEGFRAWWGPAWAQAQRGIQADPATLTQAIGADWSLVTTVWVGISVGLAIIFHRTRGATPGQLLVGVRVVPRGDGHHERRLPLGLAVRRAMAWGLVLVTSQLVVLPIVLDALMAAVRGDSQTLHDVLGRTQVVRASRGK